MLLFVDTESDPKTKCPLSVQWRYGNNSGVITDFSADNYQVMSKMWNECDAVVMFNAPYDMGVLSNLWTEHNSYEWIDNKTGQYWMMHMFGCAYRVRRIAGFRNFIRCMGKTTDSNGNAYKKKDRKPKSTPVIDLLKLWSILVDDGEKHSISLKALIERELKMKPIRYTPENALTLEYQLQDVLRLEDLWNLFLEKVSNIEAVSSYTYQQWSEIKTPATFTKLAYMEEYPDLKMWQQGNAEEDKRYKLSRALESAYHGGITIALKRGVSNRTAWFDIHGAYAHVIEYENTDQYLSYHWKEVSAEGYVPARDNRPALCHVETDAMLDTIGKSLKIYRTDRLSACYMWGYDILAMQTLFPDCTVTIDRVYELKPNLHITESLPTRWSILKEEEEHAHGKTTRREFFKFLSNTSYGIKAQRQPYKTVHTNMAIAGLITARAHLVLAEMIDEARLHGCRWIYSDTDSICVEHDEQDITELDAALNRRIAPYSQGCEGYDRRTRILSLKRYTSTGGKNLDGTIPQDKIRLHGKGQYRISQAEILAWTEGKKPPNKPLTLSSVAANTLRTLNRVVKLNPLSAKYIHPFAFETGVRSDRSAAEWFGEWFAHIDTKTTYIDGADVNDEFYREIRRFPSAYHAHSFYNSKIVDSNDNLPAPTAYRMWDKEDAYLFDSSVDA